MVRRFVRRLVSSFRSGRHDAELGREIESHLRLMEDDLTARGMSARDARFAALRAFGGVEQARERQRDVRSFRFIDNWRLDLMLGARLLVKHPGLTLVGGFGIAVAVAIAAGAFSIMGTMLYPSLPLDEGDRLVAIQLWNVERNDTEDRILHDVAQWRNEASSIQALAAYRSITRTLIAPGGQPEFVRVAEMTATGFAAARVRPLLGRHLHVADERQDAPPVLVIGYDVWRTRFASDPAIVGQPVRIGETTHTIVGVMPKGFAFPVNHGFWAALQQDASPYPRGEGPAVSVFGRLSPGATLRSARAELSAIALRTSPPDRSQPSLRTQVVPYTRPHVDMDEPENVLTLYLIQFLVALLLVVVCVNIAILVYARTATREGEIAVRTALGASRGRVVAQLFAEALALASVGAAAGVVLTYAGLRQAQAALRQLAGTELPFWLDISLSGRGLLSVVVLAVVAAAIIGIVPALKATGRGAPAGLRVLGSSGPGMRLGRSWTVLIVLQVAFAVALLPAAVSHAWDLIGRGVSDSEPTAKQFVTATLTREEASGSPVGSDVSKRYATEQFELMRRLRAEPGIAAATLALAAPGDEPTVWVEVEGVAAPPAEAGSRRPAERTGRFGHEARLNRVDVGFFDAFGLSLLAGRSLTNGDTAAAAPAVVVNRSFAERIAGGSHVLGRHVRYVGTSRGARPGFVELERWFQIVGVVDDFPAGAGAGHTPARIYHAAAPGSMVPARLAIRVAGSLPANLAARLRQVAADVNPALQLRRIASMDEALRSEQRLMRLIAAGLVLLTASVVLLSAAGIYALMSCTVVQRRKEIGIRTALGADPRRIVGSVFSRAFGQLAAGAALGVAVAALMDSLSGGDLLAGNGAIVLPAITAFMTIVGLLAAVGPARRGLSMDPVEALREE